MDKPIAAPRLLFELLNLICQAKHMSFILHFHSRPLRVSGFLRMISVIPSAMFQYSIFDAMKFSTLSISLGVRIRGIVRRCSYVG